MNINILKFFSLIVGLLFCLYGCILQQDRVLLPDDILSENIQPPSVVSGGTEDTFEQNLSPILTAKCAYSGCHDANGPDNLDFRTYQTFIRSAEREKMYLSQVMPEAAIL